MSAGNCEKLDGKLYDLYFAVPKRLLIVIGQWPALPKLQRYVRGSLALCLLLSGIPFLAIEFTHRWKTSRSRSMHFFPPSLTIFGTAVKFVNFTVNNEKIKGLLLQIQIDWRNAANAEERKILLEFRERTKKTTMFYAYFLYSLMIGFMAIPLSPILLNVVLPLNESRPKQVLYPANYFDAPIDEYYISMMAHQYASTVCAVSIIVAIDAFFIALVYHICCMFTITKYRLQNVFTEMECTKGGLLLRDTMMSCEFDSKFSDMYCTRVASSVYFHVKSIKYAASVQNTFTWSLFLVVCSSVIIISMTGIQVLTQKDQLYDVLTSLVYTAGQVCHLILLNVPGQLLTNASELARDGMWQSVSFNIPVKAQKMLLLPTMRLSYPSKLSAGKFFALNMETFMSILQTSASYFTVLANFC